MSVSIDDQIKSAKRELGFRQRCYPAWVIQNRMSQDAADRELAAMRSIIETLEQVKAGGTQQTLF